MGNRLTSRNTAMPFTNMAKLTTVASRNTATKWYYNGSRLLGSTSGIRLDDARMPGTTIRNDSFLKVLRSGIGKSTKNVFVFQPSWFYELAKNNRNFISRGRVAGFGFGENGRDETRRTINKVALNMSANVFTTVGLLFSFATFYSVSAATKPEHKTSPEDEDSHYSQEFSEPFSRKHMKECRAQNVTCNGCGIKGHLKNFLSETGLLSETANSSMFGGHQTQRTLRIVSLPTKLPGKKLRRRQIVLANFPM